MKITLESELERYAWEVMVQAHRKWEKNHGDSLRDQMEWYFDGIFKADTDEAIKAEVQLRLEDAYGGDPDITEEQYVSTARLGDGEDPGWEERYREEYQCLQAEIAAKREELTWDAKQALRDAWHRYLLAPEDLTVMFNGEVIQGK
ncbi:MAG: hypothetical protein M0Z41_08955 [Peptococcaceae bacterium]|jgi:hypothetical protein|nr:hypothetical protein [Peptococcaceae bacterium]